MYLTSTGGILALLAVALWRWGAVSRGLVVGSSTPVLGWLLTAGPIASALNAAAAIGAPALSTVASSTLLLAIARWLRAAAVAGQQIVQIKHAYHQQTQHGHSNTMVPFDFT